MGLKLTFGWVCLLILSLSVCITEAQGQTKDFNVKNYGAIADGATDNSKVIHFFYLSFTRSEKSLNNSYSFLDFFTLFLCFFVIMGSIKTYLNLKCYVSKI